MIELLLCNFWDVLLPGYWRFLLFSPVALMYRALQYLELMNTTAVVQLCICTVGLFIILNELTLHLETFFKANSKIV